MCSDQAYKKRGATEFSHKLTFIDVTCWGPLAERVATKLDKGHMVLVEGEIEQRQYISKKHGDAKITVHEIKAETVRNLGAPKAKVAVE
jgi:single-stranded DNA-binding protein